MAGILGGGAKSAPATRYQFLNIQTSTQGLCIPVGWGQFRATVNLLDYVDFRSKSSTQKNGKGGGSSSSTTYTYYCAVILGLCEGPIQGIGTVWQDKNVTSLSALGLSLFNGSQTQGAWSYMSSNHPSRALPYAGTAYVASGSYQVDSSANLPNHNFEVIDKFANTMPGSPDANLADIIVDYLTNPQYSYGFPASSIDSASLTKFKVYQGCQQLFFSPYLNNQEQSTQTFQRWAQLANSWIFWSGNLLKFVPLGDTPIATTPFSELQINDLAVHQYILNDASGTTATDTGSTHANATYVAPFALEQPSYVPGTSYSCLVEDTGYVEFPFSTPPNSSGKFSIELVWVPSRFSAAAHICASNRPDSTNQGLEIIYNFGMVAFAMANSGSGSCASASVPITAIVGEPYHILATFDGTNLQIYLNGQAGSGAVIHGSFVPGPHNICLGIDPDNPSYDPDNAPGNFQNVAFYNYALTPAQAFTHFVSAIYGGYNPDLTPIYNLTYDDFIYKTGTDPVIVTRSDPADGYNNVSINCNDRSNSYNATTILWQDQTSVDQYGQLMAQTISANEIQNTAVAQICAALIGQRSVYIRNTYAFTLGYNYVLLEPGDIVTISDPNIMLDEFPVRITNVKENKDYTLTITAEECPFGIGTAATYTVQASGGTTPPNTQVDPGNVNTPAIFEPSAGLTGGTPEVWVGLSGGVNWGGAEVFVSFDGTNYNYVGEVNSASAQGVLAAALPATADPDTTDTLEIDLTESLQTLPATATDADADAFRTLALIDGEMIAYGSAVPTAGTNPYAFSLTYLRRGLYGTAVAAHAAGAPFSRIDNQVIFTYDLPAAYVGSEIYLKFVSFNIFGNGYQDISDVTAYSYIPAGTGYFINPPGTPTATPSSVTQSDGTTLITMNVSWAASSGPNLGSYNLQYSTNSGSTWTSVPSIPGSSSSYKLTAALASTNYLFRVQAVSQNGQAISSWATSASISSGVLVTTPVAPTGIAATAAPSGAQVTWTPSTTESTTGYQVSYSTANSFSGATLWPNTTSGTGLLVTGLTPGAVYYFWVQAFNSAGASSPDGSATATPASGSSGSVTAGTAGQLAWYSATGSAVAGNVNVTYSAGAFTIGVPGTVAGSIVLAGATSGTLTIKAPAVAGSAVIRLPSSSGSNGQVLTTDGSGDLSWTTPSGGTGSSGDWADVTGSRAIGTNYINSGTTIRKVEVTLITSNLYAKAQIFSAGICTGWVTCPLNASYLASLYTEVNPGDGYSVQNQYSSWSIQNWSEKN